MSAGLPWRPRLFRGLQRQRVESTAALLARVGAEPSPAARATLEAAPRK